MKHALILEDDDDIRVTLTMLLEDEGFSVVHFAAGEDALDYLRQHPEPHLILTDWLMPIMSGSEFIRQVLEKHIMMQHRFIMIAARSPAWLPAEATATLQKWQVPYVRKPFNIEDLLATIYEVAN